MIEGYTKMRVAVLIGDVDTVSNGYIQAAQANAAIFRNTVAWAAGTGFVDSCTNYCAG
jgi:hypothetical protein